MLWTFFAEISGQIVTDTAFKAWVILLGTIGVKQKHIWRDLAKDNLCIVEKCRYKRLEGNFGFPFGSNWSNSILS